VQQARCGLPFFVAADGIFMYKNKELIMVSMIEIDDTLLRTAAKCSNFTTTKELVETALSEFVGKRNEKKLSDLKGKIKFCDNYDYKSLRNGKQNDSD
jgi:Arc/MetJ family transcription regulator